MERVARTMSLAHLFLRALERAAPSALALSSGDLIKQGIQALLDGKTKEALDLFTELYGQDANFRDVATKVRDLRSALR